MVHRPS